MKRRLELSLNCLFESRPQAQWSLLRIGLGLSLLVDAVFRFQYAPEFYGSENPVIRAETVLAPYLDSPQGQTIATALKTIWSNDLWLHIAQIALVLALITLCLGIKTKAAAAVALLVSELLNLRNPLFQYIGNTYSSVLLLFIILSPADRYFSILRSRDHSNPPSFVLTVAKLNISIVYLLTLSSKLIHSEWRDGTALYYILNLDHLARFAPDSTVIQFIASSPLLVAAMTYAVLFIQLLLSTFIWWPRCTNVIVALGIGMHIGMIVFLRLGVIQLVSISALLLFLNDATARRLLSWLTAARAGVSVFRHRTSAN